MNKSLLVLMAAAILQFACQDRLSAQTGSPASAGQQCSFSGVYQQGGWTIPGLSGAVPSGPRAALVYRVDGIEDPKVAGVFSTTLKAGNSHSNLTLLRCSPDASGQLIARFLPVKVLEMRRFDFNGKVFAYGINYEVELMGPGGLRSSLEYVPVVFYDTDGTGHFTLLKYATGSMFRSLEVPEWTKKLSK